MPASTKERTIEGPEDPIASPMTTKMPVPMIAPRPSAVRSPSPTTRLSDWPFSWVSRTRTSVGLTAKGPPRLAVVAMVEAPRRWGSRPKGSAGA